VTFDVIQPKCDRTVREGMMLQRQESLVRAEDRGHRRDDTGGAGAEDDRQHCLRGTDALLLLVERGARFVGCVPVAVEPHGEVLWNDTLAVSDKVDRPETIVARFVVRNDGASAALT